MKEGWTEDERRSLATLIEIQPDLSEIVDDRDSRLKVWTWVRSITNGIVEFLKWAAMIGAAIGLAKGLLHGWLK